MESPSSAYSEQLLQSPMSALALPSPAVPFATNAPSTIRKRSFSHVTWSGAPKAWGAEKVVLKSIITDEEFELGYPQGSLLCRRRMFDRATDRGRLCDPNGWQGSMENQLRFEAQMARNKDWRERRGFPLHGSETFKTVDWKMSATSYEVSVSPCTVPAEMTNENDAFSSVNWDGPTKKIEQSVSAKITFGDSKLTETDMAKYEESLDFDSYPQTPSSTHSSLDPLVPKFAITDAKKSVKDVMGLDDDDEQDVASSCQSATLGITLTAYPSPTVSSTISLARFVDQEAPGLHDLMSSRYSNHAGSDAESEDFLLEDVVIEEATIAMPIAIPPRGRSLLNLRVLEAGAASRACRPIADDSEVSSDDSLSLTTHHTNLIPTTFETGTARIVRMYRPPPVRLIIVRGRVVAMTQAEAEEVGAPWETASLFDRRESGCAGSSHLWSKIKRKFHRG